MRKDRKQEIIETLKGCIDLKNRDLVEYYQNLQEKGRKIPKDTDFQKVLRFCNALGNEDRLKIFEILKEKDRCVCELEAYLDKSQPTISHHLRILENIELIRGWKKGRFTHYDILKENLKKYRNLLRNFLEI
ncbi:MAG: metalloregulator ArsR/SmtB family transcription factor [Promethearchaeia archaeon]